jgi:hypothetical protein
MSDISCFNIYNGKASSNNSTKNSVAIQYTTILYVGCTAGSAGCSWSRLYLIGKRFVLLSVLMRT